MQSHARPPHKFALRPLYLGLSLTFSGLSAASFSALACDPPAGHLAATEGRIEVRAAGEGQWRIATPRQPLCPGDQVAVRGPGRAAVVLAQDVLVRLDHNTTLTLPGSAATGELKLPQGVVHVISRFSRRFGIITPFVNAFVDGTEFTVTSDDSRARVVVAEGRVRTGNSAGELRIEAGQAIEARVGSAPAGITVRPLDAVAWAIHYPQVQHLRPVELATYPEATRQALAAAQGELAAGRARNALDHLAPLSAVDSTPALAALKAGVLLGLGQVDAAGALVARFAPGTHPALDATATVIRVARNDPAALETARQNVERNPDAPAAQLAYSYALQAARQLPAALEAARRATALSPDAPLAHARQAELELGLGRAGPGGDAARRALTLAPDTPRAAALAAFALLLTGNTSAAAADFAAALARNDTDPLAHFGLGLALMRQGQTEAGRREVEIAALLDPANAELRSYLGRAYMEEARSKVAGDQFDLARRLDPGSPTPWYFDAFRQLREGEPLAALYNGEEALARNANRSVLRSGTLLDQDRAARSASLGAAYQQVGLAAPAQAAAMNAIESDPASPAAHRLLADAYAEVPRFEGARLSELLQANLRQPIGQWPQAPQFVMPPLPLFDGPRAISPDEATAFFERKPTRFAATVGGGSHSAMAASALLSHAWDQGQISFGSFDYRYAGLTDTISDTHLAGSRLDARVLLTPGTTLLAEARHTERHGGAQYRNLFDGQATNLLRRNLNDLGRIALHHELGEGDEILVEANTQRFRELQKDYLQYRSQAIGLDINSEGQERHRTRGLSALYTRQREKLGLSVGATTARLSGKQDIGATMALSMDPRIVLDITKLPTRTLTTDRDTAFGYAQWRVTPALTLHGGADYVRFEDTGRSQAERINGKLGAVLRPATGTTLRAAVLQGVSGSRYDAENLAPTQFAGFNQVFDDISGTRWRRVAVAAEQHLSDRLSGGLEASWRWLDAPMVDPGASNGYHLEDWKESLHRAHLAFPFGRRALLSAEWRRENIRYEGGNKLVRDTPWKVDTDLLPLRLWLKTGRAEVLLEHWLVRQRASQIASTGAESDARSTFTVTNLRLSLPLVPQRVNASLGVYNLFDRDFRFHNTDLNGAPRVSLFYPQRTLMLQGQLHF
ncbi:FecR domain-containing protein [Zoogloea sp.]|uniref:FecR domain-containing protein n=1 Tax=Zoogloea sp. TaxID=49181 RepID=UPI002CB74236|nr:FecR domain-containing protein [Zoogloea sp.]HOY00638.1 TonB-dependent receptor [Zoogloea sp.]HPI59291.1 TonB-dependent receptor [Zoogloea sp.]